MSLRRIIPPEKRTVAGSRSIANIRPGATFLCGIYMRWDGVRDSTPWCGSRELLAAMIDARRYRVPDAKLLYIIRATRYERSLNGRSAIVEYIDDVETGK